MPSAPVSVHRTFLLVGALAGCIAVGFGAFGAHGLKGRISPEYLVTFETGVRYQMYHALALLAVALAAPHLSARLLTAAGWLFATGIVLFSGSLYVLVLAGIPMMGAVTPLGGVAFLGGWLCLVAAALR